MIIILWIISLILPFIEKRVNLQGGTQIISNPISTNNESKIWIYIIIIVVLILALFLFLCLLKCS